MYVIDKRKKESSAIQWDLPDRVFFACGACHILTYTFIQSNPDFQALWIKPHAGYRGNHIIAANGKIAFDYHGISNQHVLLKHTFDKANRWWSGWNMEVIPLPEDVLISEEKSKTYEGLWLRQPDQFYKNPIPRAQDFIQKTLLSS